MSNDTLLRSYAGRAFAEEAVVNRIGPGKGDDELIRWLDSTFDMDEVYQLRDGEISRKGDKAAFVSYDVAHHGESFRTGFNRVRVYRLNGRPARAAGGLLLLRRARPGGPDELALVLPGREHARDAVRRRALDRRHPGSFEGCQSPTFFKDLLPGAQPDWGPADVPVAAARSPPLTRPRPRPLPAPKPPSLALTLPKGISSSRHGARASPSPSPPAWPVG